MTATDQQLSTVDRVRAKLLQDVAGRRLDLGTMVSALRLVSTGVPGLQESRVLAEAARALPPDAHAVLLRAASEAWQRGVTIAVARALRRSADGASRGLSSLDEAPAPAGGSGDISPELGAIVQALCWAALPAEAPAPVQEALQVRLVAAG